MYLNIFLWMEYSYCFIYKLETSIKIQTVILYVFSRIGFPLTSVVSDYNSWRYSAKECGPVPVADVTFGLIITSTNLFIELSLISCPKYTYLLLLLSSQFSPSLPQ